MMLGMSLAMPSVAARGGNKARITGIAFGGDSTIAGTAVGLTGTQPTDVEFIRILNDAKFAFVPGAASIMHGSGGITSAQFVSGWPSSGYLFDQIAAGSRVDVYRLGINDVTNGATNASIVANMLTCVQASRGAGHIPVILAVTPMPLSVSGNGAGAKSSQIAALNPLLSAMCAANAGYFIDQTSVLCTAPGNGIMDEQWASAPGNLHPSPGAYHLLGAAEATVFASLFNFIGAPLANQNWITANVDFSAGSSSPTGWNLFANSDTVVSSMVTDATLGRLWQIALTTKVGSGWTVWNQTAISSPVGKSIDGLLRFRVTAGAFSNLQFTVRQQDNSTALAGALQFTNSTQVFSAGSAIYTIPTPRPVTVAGGITLVAPWVFLTPVANGATIQFLPNGFGVRQYS